MVAPVPTPIELTAAEREALRAAAAQDAPELAARLDGPVDVVQIDQHYFPHHRILEVTSRAPLPSLRVHVAIGPIGTKILTGHSQHLHAMCDADPIQESLGARQRALDYAAAAYAWTDDAPPGEVVLNFVEELVWPSDPSEALRARIQLFLALYRDRIEPQTQRHTNLGWELRFYVISEGRLIDRRLHLPFDGKLFRDDEVVTTSIPMTESVPAATPGVS